MKNSLTIICICLTCSCAAQTTAGWYKMLTGTIDKYPVVIYLYQQAHTYEGYYYYTSQQVPISFTGEDTTTAGKIKLTAMTDADKAEHFSFTLTGNTAIGTWKQEGKSNALSLLLTEADMPVSFTYAVAEGSVKLRKTLKDSPEATFEASSVWPVGNTPTDVFIQAQIRKLFDDKQQHKDIATLLNNKKEAFLKDYILENKDITNKDLKDMASAYNNDESDHLLISYQSSKIISLSFASYAFTGGAHGNYGASYLSLDVVNNKVLQLKDILNAQGIKKLRSLLENNFRKQYNLQPADSLTEGGLFENTIEPNNNFYVTGKGLSFTYNPYEIGPYAMGEIDIFISFKDLQAYLQPGFIRLLE